MLCGLRGIILVLVFVWCVRVWLMWLKMLCMIFGLGSRVMWKWWW